MRVLIVEDDKKIAASVAKNLKAEGYAVDIAEDGVKGEMQAKVNEYDVILLDVMLPKRDGWTVCSRLRKEGILTPILMLTALNDVSDKIKGLDSGADDYLPKPFHIGELLARIRSLSRRSLQVKTSLIECFGVVLDQSTHKVSRGGKEVLLSAKEFALLELFMTHPKKILTRDTISEHVWDMNFERNSNVIESFVKFLRQKVDKGFSPSLIHTVRGAGYVFSDEEE